jgi:release factor glutamine methyltransferase
MHDFHGILSFMPTIAELLDAHHLLQKVSDTAQLDTELLLCHCLQQERSFLWTWPQAQVPAPLARQFSALLERRRQGEPIAYLIGTREFWSLPLKVSPATLIPRPETELLVEQILEKPLADNTNVLDLGTGTGAIALALASERPQWIIEGCDIAPDAVQLAQHNAQQLGLESVRFYQSDWFQGVGERRFDVIVANPPYIAADDPCLQQGDVRFEPHSALVAEQSGFAALATIIKQSVDYLRPQGWLLLEHGWQQASTTRELFSAAGFDAIATHCDLAGLERVTCGQWLSS